MHHKNLPGFSGEIFCCLIKNVNDSVVSEFLTENDRLAHLPQMVCGWLDALPPALVRGVPPVRKLVAGGARISGCVPIYVSFRTSPQTGVGISIEFWAVYRHTVRSNLPFPGIYLREIVLLSRRLPRQCEHWLAMTGNSIQRQCAKRSFISFCALSGNPGGKLCTVTLFLPTPGRGPRRW